MDTVKISAISCSIKGEKVNVLAVNYDADVTCAYLFYANKDGVFDDNYVAKQRWGNDQLSNYIDDNTKIKIILEYMIDPMELIGKDEVFSSLGEELFKIQTDYNLKSWL